MCRGVNNKICTELGDNPENWDTQCLLPQPSWFSSQVDIFESAVNHFLFGDREKCLVELNRIRSEEITNWYIEHGQMSGRHRKEILGISRPLKVEEKDRDPQRSPIKLQEFVFNRDGYKCRYCGNRLISQDFIRLFIKKLDSPIFQRGKSNVTTNGIIHITWPVADHVIPWNIGGRTNLKNLVSSCAPCNYGKDGYTIQQIGIQNPFTRNPKIDQWNGLSNKLEELRQLKV